MDESEPHPGRADDPVEGPLPRRSQQQHLEPQLRVVGGSGHGTPFAAFDDGTGPADEPVGEPTPDVPVDRATAAQRAAAFQRGTGRDS